MTLPQGSDTRTTLRPPLISCPACEIAMMVAQKVILDPEMATWIMECPECGKTQRIGLSA